MGQILPLDVPPFTWKYLIRKSLGSQLGFLGRWQINAIQTGTLSRKAKAWTEPWIKPLLCYSSKFLQLAKFALPPSFGETAQARGKNLPLLPRTAGECSTSSTAEFIAPEGQSRAMGPGHGCLSELHRKRNILCTNALKLHHPLGISLKLKPTESAFSKPFYESAWCHKSHVAQIPKVFGTIS